MNLQTLFHSNKNFELIESITKEHTMTETHFIARPRKSVEGGWAITLYRFKTNEQGTERPQYLGPLGWNYHIQQKDSDVLKELKPISELKTLTGDDLENQVFTGLNIYAG